MTATTRRAALTALASVGALALPAVPAIVAVHASTDDDLPNLLWARRHALRRPKIEATIAYEQASAKMPEWAQPGRQMWATEAN